MTKQPVHDDIAAFIYHEAHLLDAARFDDWLALFASDGHYWMPAARYHTDPVLQASLMYEDFMLLQTRVARLAGPRTFSQKPASACHHLLQQPRVCHTNAIENRFVAETAFHYVETRGDECHGHAGWARHELKLVDGCFKIHLKRVDLVNIAAPLPSIQLFI